MNSYSDIKLLGSGTLVIDALTGLSVFDGQPTDTLSIAEELHLWLIEDCGANNIPIDKINDASLVATLDLSKTDWKQRISGDQWFDTNGRKINGRIINRCIIECESKIQTETYEYRSNYRDVEEWPDGFLEPN